MKKYTAEVIGTYILVFFGCGTAVFLSAEAGEAAGLPVHLAATLAEATVSGAGELMRQSELSPAQLRRNVTSPNGTTQAALEVLMGQGGMPDLLREAVERAARRSRELAG